MEPQSFVICPSSFVLKQLRKGKPMKKLMMMVVAACACMATAAYGATVYQVTENGIVDGIDLTTLISI